jgi:hypothetical protein
MCRARIRNHRSNFIGWHPASSGAADDAIQRGDRTCNVVNAQRIVQIAQEA